MLLIMLLFLSLICANDFLFSCFVFVYFIFLFASCSSFNLLVFPNCMFTSLLLLVFVFVFFCFVFFYFFYERAMSSPEK